MDPFLGELRLFGGSFAPEGWAECFGQLLSISEFSALYALYGTTFGGDGVSTFGLPDLRGRVPVHTGSNGGTGYARGQLAGAEAVTLTTPQLPAHTHGFTVSGQSGTIASPSNAIPAAATGVKGYRTGSATAAMAADAVSSYGGSQPHGNVQPSLGVRYIVAIYGIYPQQS